MSDSQEIEVKLDHPVRRPPLASDEYDVFNKKAEEIKKFEGVDSSTRRRVNRELTKRRQNTEGSVSSKEIQPESYTGYMLFDVIMPPHNLDYLAAVYTVSPANYAAVNAKVANIVGLGYDLVETPRTQERIDNIDDEDRLKRFRTRLRREKFKMLEWIEGRNEEDTFLETLIRVWTDYEATGNGYLEIGRTREGRVGYIGHIPATTIRVRRKRDGFVQVINEKAQFFRNFGDTKTANPVGSDRPNEIIHIKKYSPSNGYYGVPDIVAAKNALAGNEFAARYNLDYFENKAVPRYIITLKGGTLSSTSEKRLFEFLQTGLRGQNHRSLYIPLPPDSADSKVEFKMDAVESGIQDASFTNYRKGNLSDILMAHRVPLSKVSTGEGVSLALARDADKTFKEQVCRPAQRIFEKKLNKIISELTDIFELRLNELSLTDEDTQSKIDERYLRMQVIVPNEVRARKGMPGIANGDSPVDLKSQSGAEQRAQARNTRTRDQDRDANAPDNDGEARNEQGAGRQSE